MRKNFLNNLPKEQRKFYEGDGAPITDALIKTVSDEIDVLNRRVNFLINGDGYLDD